MSTADLLRTHQLRGSTTIPTPCVIKLPILNTSPCPLCISSCKDVTKIILPNSYRTKYFVVDWTLRLLSHKGCIKWLSIKQFDVLSPNVSAVDNTLPKEKVTSYATEHPVIVLEAICTIRLESVSL